MMPPRAAHLEIEVKLQVKAFEPVRDALHARGARLEHSRTFEENLRFDTPERTLAQRNEVLRLRRSFDVRLTFKQRPQPGPGLLARPEFELGVEDFDTMRLVLERLGYLVVVRYEKYRETHQLGGVTVALDELPYGNFVELEGPSSATLQAAAAELGLPWASSFQGSYLSIFAWLRAHRALTAGNLTFAEVTGCNSQDLGLPGSASEPSHF